MKNFLKFILLAIVKIVSTIAAMLLISWMFYAFPDSPFLAWTVELAADGYSSAFASQTAIVLSYLACALTASKLNAKKPLIFLCIADGVLQIFSLISNIIHDEWLWPNIVALFACAITIHFAKTDMQEK